MSLSPTKASWISTQEATFYNVVISSKDFWYEDSGSILSLSLSPRLLSFRREPETMMVDVTLKS